MATEFDPKWSRLLQAQSIHDAGKAPVEQEYWFEVMEWAIKRVQARVAGDEKILLDLAADRVGAEKLRLSYSQIVGASKPWRLELQAQPAPASTWHDAFPVGLLVLVADDLNSVAEVEVKEKAAPQELDRHWERLAALLIVLEREIHADETAWSTRLRANFFRRDMSGDVSDRIYGWITIAFAGDTSRGTFPGVLLLPALRKSIIEADAVLQTPDGLLGAIPAVGSRAELTFADPRTFIPLHEPCGIEFVASASDSDRVNVTLPMLETDELSWASLLLRRYRAHLDTGTSDWGTGSLWDAALELDPPADEPRPGDAKWRLRCEEFNRRLAFLVNRGLGGFSDKDREILSSAVWARRLTKMADAGLAYTEDGGVALMQKVSGAVSPSAASDVPATSDDAADKAPVAPKLEADPLLCAFYLAVRMGGSASSASARSLDISGGDIGSGVAGLLMRPEQVYVDVAKKIKERLRIDTEGVTVQTVIEWLRTPRARNFRAGRSLTGSDVFALTKRTPRLVQQGIASGEIADVAIKASSILRLSSARMRVSLVKALKRIYEKPRAGGLPAFVSDLVYNGVDAGSEGEIGTQAQPPDREPGQDIPDGLKRLLVSGFADAENLLCHLTSKAKASGMELRGARDIVRMGRRRFIDLFQQEPKFPPELLSRLYSRAWSKTNARAQFIAAARSSDAPSTGGQDSGPPAETEAGGESNGPIDQEKEPAPTRKPDFPDLASLFGLTDLPTCTWGDSIHGPAAYLADILEFLRHRRLIAADAASEESSSALALLLARRPDLAEIDLSDKNATVEMPFIDLINELLEQELAGADAFKIGARLNNWVPKDGKPLEPATLHTLQSALQTWGVHLLEPVVATPVPERAADRGCKHEQWVIRDRTGTALRASRHIDGSRRRGPWQVRLMPQATLTSDELAAEPQYVERQAYATLSTTTAGGSYKLPWSLGEAQLEEWLGIVNGKVAHVLAGARPDGLLQTNEAWLPRSVSLIGMSQAEGAGLVFGTAEDTLLLDRSHTKNASCCLADFLRRSEISFEEARALEQTHAIGGQLGFHVVAVGCDPCSADSNRIRVEWTAPDGPSTTAKFLRLRRRLGWTVADLDLALGAPNIGNRKFDAAFARNLSQVLELSRSLGLTAQEVLRIFTRLRTTALGHATTSEWASVFLDSRVNGADAYRDAEALKLLRALTSPGGRRSTIESQLVQIDQIERAALESRLRTMIGAVLRLSPEDLDILNDSRHGPGTSWQHLTSEKLSQLYGASVLLRALGLKPKELHALVTMTPSSPFLSPGRALELVSFQQELDVASLKAQALALYLRPPEGAEAPEGEAMAWYSPAVVMEAVLELHKALESIETKEASVLLQAGATNELEAPQAWLKYLEAAGSVITINSTWAERLSLLIESVRRQLPRIKLDTAALRRQRAMSYPLGHAKECEASSHLLTDDLEKVEVLLSAELPEGLAPVGNATRSDGASNVTPGVKPGVDLLHPKVAKWIVEVFAPVLQWAGVEREEVLARLAPWLELQRGSDTRQTLPKAALPSEPAQAAAFASYLLCQPLERHAFRIDRQVALSAALAQTIGAPEAHAWALLVSTPASAQAEGTAAEWWLQRNVEQAREWWRGPSALSFEKLEDDDALHMAIEHVKVLLLFWRAVGGLGLDAPTIAWLSGPSSAAAAGTRSDRLRVLASKDLYPPATQGDSSDWVRQLASRWRRLAAWAKVIKATPDVKRSDGMGEPLSLLGDVLELMLSKDDAAQLTEEEWGCIGSSVERLLGLAPSGAMAQLGRVNAKALVDPATYGWLMSVDALQARTGLAAEEVTSIATALSGRMEADQQRFCATLRASLRKRFTESAWQGAVREGQDRLREQKRDALVDSLLNKRESPWQDMKGSRDRLYEYLLLDTQMAASMTTSRIVQAHAAVQQFSLRCTMGLEEGWQIPVTELFDWNQWKWMRTYRVWEACRKIFLYPENWMEPEIRDDKSRFFEELEGDLNQGELTNENAETSFVRYLHKLNEVARLDVVATYYEFDPNEPVMHVLGRTPSQPFRYFYRQWVDERRWTPWEPVDLEIDTNHVVLFKRGGRLHLGWMTAVHEESRPEIPKKFKTTKIGDDYTVDGIEEPKVRWKLQLTTSQRMKEGWQAKRTSPGSLAWPRNLVSMSELASKNRTQLLQLTYQDYGIPEILVTANAPADGRASGDGAGMRRFVVGSFSLTSCLGMVEPEQAIEASFNAYPVVEGTTREGSRLLQSAPSADTNQQLILVEGTGDGALVSAHPSVLKTREAGVDPTPGRFAVTMTAQASLLDAAIAIARAALVPVANPEILPMGLGLPFFYSDDAIDIVVRTNFSASVAVGGGQPTQGSITNARHIARVLGTLSVAVQSDAVQQVVWGNRKQGVTDDQWANRVALAIEKAAPTITVSSLLRLLESVSAPYPSGADGPFELAARTHHPLACELVNRAEGRGVASVFAGHLQDLKRDDVYRGRTRTWLSDEAIKRFSVYALSFVEGRDAYAGYNWEVFYHAPFMIAMKFSSEAKFEDSLRWFQYIFDPIGVDASAEGDQHERQFWKTQPFRTSTADAVRAQSIDVLLDPDKWKSIDQADALHNLVDSVMAWRQKPNLPFQVARGRWVAFQKAVVYRYVETIIAWADARFRIDTREEITAASQLYVLAARLLGRRPRTDISMCDRAAASGCGSKSYEQLQELIDRRDDELSRYLDTLFGQVDDILDCSENEEPDSPHLNFYNEYFCFPPNEKLLELWDRVADRLYKVRNSLNIDGVYRSLSLFAPPIDPALLARAGAAGLSFDQIMAGLNQPRSHYRFTAVLQKANEIASELRTLGGELLQALEKRDAEELTLLRSRLDLQAIRLNRDVRDEQIREAKTQLEAVDTQIETVEARQDWYKNRIGKGTSPKELESIDGIRSGLLVRTRVAAMKSTAAIASALPKFTVGANGAFGSPHFGLTISGEFVANAQNFFADKLAIEGDKDQTAAGITATLAGYERRIEEWQLQRDMASGELANLRKQRTAAEIRLTIALTEKRNLERSIESAETTDAFLKSKFTNARLYDWMVRQVSAVYYKTYQLASDYARAAEDCLNRELPVSLSGVKVVRSDHWNGLRKGLLAATGLIHDLKRLEAEHIKRNKRVPELTKHVSLAIVDPVQLLNLRATGSCSFKIPEILFEMDHPGHVARRIKSVALSVPCVVGPYTGVSCKLSLMGSGIRRRPGDGIERVLCPAEAIFTSSGNNDSGLWEPNLRDERYLPFEGAGAVDSEWRLDLPATVRQFDYTTISDVVLHIRYIAEPGIERTKAEKDLAEKLHDAKKMGGAIWVYTSLRSDLSDQFAALAYKPGGQPIKLKLPRGLANWLGQPIEPTGRVKLAILGESQETPSVWFMGSKRQVIPHDSANGFWTADFDLERPKDLFAPNGFEVFVDGMSQLRDVVIYFSGAVGGSP